MVLHTIYKEFKWIELWILKEIGQSAMRVQVATFAGWLIPSQFARSQVTKISQLSFQFALWEIYMSSPRCILLNISNNVVFKSFNCILSIVINILMFDVINHSFAQIWICFSCRPRIMSYDTNTCFSIYIEYLPVCSRNWRCLVNEHNWNRSVAQSKYFKREKKREKILFILKKPF